MSSVRVRTLPHPLGGYLARVIGGHVGYVDWAGESREEAVAGARRRYLRAWLGTWVPQDYSVGDEGAGSLIANRRRLALWRYIPSGEPAPDGVIYHWIMLNPSTSDGTDLDPTMRRVCGFSAARGATWVTVSNLYTRQGSKPALIWADSPAGREDLRWSWQMAAAAMRSGGRIILAWGNPGARQERGLAWIQALYDRGLTELYCLGLTKKEEPRHPLYVASTTKMERI